MVERRYQKVTSIAGVNFSWGIGDSALKELHLWDYLSKHGRRKGNLLHGPDDDCRLWCNLDVSILVECPGLRFAVVAVSLTDAKIVAEIAVTWRRRDLRRVKISNQDGVPGERKSAELVTIDGVAPLVVNATTDIGEVLKVELCIRTL